MHDIVEIGLGKNARRGYHLYQVAIVPSRRTRGSSHVSTGWQLDAFGFDIPMVTHPSDATVSPAVAVKVGELGGLGVLNAEGLWTRYDDPTSIFERLLATEGPERTALLQQVYAEPVKPELIRERVAQMIAATGESRAPIAVRVSPQHTLEFAPVAIDAGIDVLVVQGTVVSAEHVAGDGRVALNLKRFIKELDLPVIVGGCADYQTALHLMRTGAAAVIVGNGSDAFSTSDDVLGLRVPMATAIADAAAARRDYLDETGGRYVHVIADGDVHTSGDIARAIGCGADAVMLGSPLAAASEAPGRGAWWHSVASHPQLPRGLFGVGQEQWPAGDISSVLHGPATQASGELNLFGGLKRAMAKAGYEDVKAFQRVELTLDL